MRPKKTPLRMCAGCGEMKPKKELARVVRAPQKEDESGSPLPPEISLDLTGKKPGRGAYLCLDAQCLKQARKSRRLEALISAIFWAAICRTFSLGILASSFSISSCPIFRVSSEA